MVYLTSDLHGYPLNDFLQLLKQANFGRDDFLFILGDVTDRGEHGIELIKWIMLQPNVELILGNHECMLLSCSFLFDEITDETIDCFSRQNLRKISNWRANGADPTLRDLQRETADSRAAILEYLHECPLYDAITVGGRDFMLVHGGLGEFSEDRPMSDYSERELVWTRPQIDTVYSKRFTTVFGHTPTAYYGEQYRGKCIITDTWIDIDTGKAFGLHPMLLRLDDMQEFYPKENI